MVVVQKKNMPPALKRASPAWRSESGRGRHDIPEAVIRRRFAAGRENFERLYAPRVDAWALYDNGGAQPVLLDWSEKS